MVSIHPRRLLDSVQPHAAALIKQAARLQRLAGKAASTAAIALTHYPAFAEITEALDTAIRLLRAYVRGTYRQIPHRALLALIGGLVYLVSPFDAIPDFLVTIGFIDDLAVLTLVLRQIRHDLDAFRAWEEQQRATVVPPLLLGLDNKEDAATEAPPAPH